MCGFFITNNPKVTLGQESIVEKTLRFRGPDYSSGFIKKGNWIIYHSRLSIIDMEAEANQPIINEDGSVLVFNGEILNYKELGYKYFSTEFFSDTLLLNELIKYNLLDYNELDGFFAFVYVSGDGALKHAVRDRFGVKPLYYHMDDKFISFSSEVITLKSLFNVTINDDAIQEYFMMRSPIFSGSFFNEIKSIEPGNCFIMGQYFNPLNYIQNGYEDVSSEVLEQAIMKGVSTRRVSDAGIGLLLSRGIDSNLINNLYPFNYKYSIGFKGDEDIEYLRQANIDNLKIVECDSDTYKEAFHYLLELRGEPMSVPNEVLLYLIAGKAAADNVKVLLSGEGADEFFGGYDRIFSWAVDAKEFHLGEFIKLYAYSDISKSSKLYQQFIEIFSKVEHLSPFEKVRWFFIRYHMPVLFRRLDFSLMAAGVEGREPIANMHTFTKAITISPSELMHNKLGKIPLRNIIQKYMGHNFAFEKKVGFPVDLTKIFDGHENKNSYEIWFAENMRILEK